jgi:mRNA interferase RelE/StbE
VSYTIHIKASAEREMASLPKAAFHSISKRMLDLEKNPRPQGCKKLSGREEYRVRAGDYRVLYVVDDAAGSIEVVAVGNRKDVYRR